MCHVSAVTGTPDPVYILDTGYLDLDTATKFVGT